MDPRERFGVTVEDYKKHRPDYPEPLIDWVIEDAALATNSLVIDVGCGTGISSRHLAARGLRVIGVDPNDAMLAEARRSGESEMLRYVKGDAETLAVDAVADALVCAQALHWVDLDRALPRFRAQLRDGGRVVAFWNLRDESEGLMADYEALLLASSSEYAEVGAEPRTRKLLTHPGVRERREATFPHGQRLDRAGFHGRVWSSSYVRHGVSDVEAFDRQLDALFDRYAVDGFVWFRYRSLAVGFFP